MMKAKKLIELVEDKKEHRLIIKSLHDGQAECSAGDWSFSQTGSVSKEAIQKEFKKHLSGLKEQVSEQKNTLQDLIGMIAELVMEFTEGRASSKQNPYSRPVVRKALEMLAAEIGVKDKYDVDLKKLVRG